MSEQGQPVAGPAAAVPVAAPVVAPVVPPAPAPAVAVPPVDPAAAAAPPADPAAAPPARDWREKRIDQLVAKLAEERARSAELERQARAAVPAAAPPSSSVSPPPAPASAAPAASQAEFEAAVDRAAALKAQVAQWNAECNAVAQAGRATYGEAEFNTKAAALLALVDRNDPQAMQNYNSFLMAAIKTGEGPRILFELGSDLNEAMRVMSVSPIEMAVDMTRRAMRQPAAAPSGAPRPITPVGGRGAVHTPIDPSDPARAKNLPIDDWMSRREVQAEEHRKKKLGIA